MNRTVARRLSRIRNERRSDDDRWMPTTRIAYRIRTSAGTIITGDTALTIAAVWACIRFLSLNIAGLPWNVHRPTNEGRSSERVMRHPVQRVLDRPSPEWSTDQFRETMMSWALRRGNAVAEIERDTIGQPLALHPIHPDRVEFLRDLNTGRMVYKIDNGTDEPSILQAQDVFHIRGFGESPVGLNVMAIAAESLGWAKAAQLFGANFFGSGATPSGVVTMKRPLTPEGLESLETRFHRLYGGAQNANKVAFLDNEMEYKAISIDPDKGQFLETNQYLLDEVCRWFGVPPHKIYNLLRATFSNIEHQSIEVVQDSLRPWAKRFQNEADYKLFGTENRQRLYTVMDFTELLRGDTKTRMEYYRNMREIGVLSANEIRENEDLPPIPTGDGGEKRVMQGQYTTLEQIGEQPAPGSTTPGGNAPAEEPDEPDEPAPDDDAASQQTETNHLVRFLLNCEAVKTSRVDA